jgi:hypothetical protein
MKRKIITVLVIGVLIRLFLAFSTFHSDLQPFYFAGEVIAKGNVLNFYDYLGNLPSNSPILKVYPTNLFNYPPLVYFSLGPVSYLISLPFNRDLIHNFIFNLPGILGNLQLNFLLLVLKLPYLLFDVGIAFLLSKLFKDPKNKFLVFTVWMFNPINLYATYMMGQFDVIPTFFAVLALYFAVKKDKYLLSAFFLGLGASFKIFPFLFLVPLAFLHEKWLDRIKIVGVGILTYSATILPFLRSSGFRATALVAGQTTKSLYPKIDISGGEAILLFPAFLIFFYVLFLYRQNLREFLWQKFFIVILLFFIFTHYHPQWFVWVTPFLIIDLIKSKFTHWPLVVLSVLSFTVLLTFFDPGMTVRLFAPLVPNLNNLPGVWDFLDGKIDINMARSLFQTVFVGAAFYYIYHYFPKKEAT